MNVLAALDGSEGAYEALRTACRIAARSRVTVTIFHANKGQEYTAEETGWTGIAEKLASELEDAGRRVIERSRAIGREHGMDLPAVVAYGVPAAAILDHAYDHGIVGLVALGHSSKGRAAEGFAGSTTRTVVALARVPVLVTSRAMDVRGIVLAVDEPASARKAAAFAGAMAELVGTDVRLLSVVPSADAVLAAYGQIAEVRGLSRYVEDAQRAYDRMGEEACSTARELLAGKGRLARTVVRKGRPAEEILAEVGPEELLMVGLSSSPSGRRVGPVASRLLSARAVAAVFV